MVEGRGARASEYGGVPGRIQPPPHDPNKVAHEQLQAVYATDAADETSGPEVVVAEWLKEGARRRD